ncbi:MAG TPA: NupC/NupG family nucleoside CNT transporter [Bacteriovoracaceae bacterium]|nr:NupC/NupG family nucleoside CNT transporter [Bacteriovoracaceae bacterium]
MDRLVSLLGLVVMLSVAYLMSENKKAIQWRTVISGIVLQLVFGLFILKTSFGRSIFDTIGKGFNAILGYTGEGAKFLFGGLATPSESLGFIFATMVLPTIIFMSALMSVLYHLGIMQKVVEVVARVMMKVMKTSGAESLAAAANIFVGQTEAPLVIKPYVNSMTKSELMCLMTGGMATVAGGVLAAYVGFGIDAGHLLAASVMSAPAALVCAKLMVPEVEISATAGIVKIDLPPVATNVIDAAATGASDGLKLAVNVAAMLLAFIALIAMLNGILSGIGGLFGFPQLTFEFMMGYLNAPVAWLLGVPWEDCLKVGSILGKKLVLNEFVGYLDLIAAKAELSERSTILTTYALCGFSNFSSIAIQLGGIGTMAPEKRGVLAAYGMRAMIAGTLACYMTACIAGILI